MRYVKQQRECGSSVVKQQSQADLLLLLLCFLSAVEEWSVWTARGQQNKTTSRLFFLEGCFTSWIKKIKLKLNVRVLNPRLVHSLQLGVTRNWLFRQKKWKINGWRKSAEVGQEEWGARRRPLVGSKINKDRGAMRFSKRTGLPSPFFPL